MFRCAKQLLPDRTNTRHGARPRIPPRASGPLTGRRRKRISNDHQTGQHESRQSGQYRKDLPPRQCRRQILPGLLRKENRKDDQHHDPADVYHDLDRRDKFHLQPEIQPRNSREGEQKPDGGTEYFPGSHRQQGGAQDKYGKDIEDDGRRAHYSTPSLILEPGLFNFFVSWLRSYTLCSKFWAILMASVGQASIHKLHIVQSSRW